MQKLKCDLGLLQYVGGLLFRRNLVTRTRNLYEVLGLNRTATAVRKFIDSAKGVYFRIHYDADPFLE